ncbi:MAG: hypothetical protein FWD38_06150 [Oscillospiraceae bacterium]|nr:hypothetical protein [Oscillospiraceae bacterium]
MKYPEYSGIEFNFERQRQALTAQNTGKDGFEYFYVLGHYDYLTIREVCLYEQFSPSLKEKPCISNGYEDTYKRSANSFLVRATIPSDLDDMEKYPEGVFSYSIHDIGMIEHKCKPFFTAILLNFTYSAIKEQGLSALTKKVADIVRKVSDSYIEKPGTKQTFAVYNCLGSIDCIVVCRSNNFSIATDSLRAIKMESDIICASYFIPMIVSYSSDEDKIQALESTVKSGVDEDIEFFIRATLRPGVAWEDLKADLKVFCEQNDIISNELEIPDVAYNVSGTHDLLFKISKNPSALCKLMLNKGSPLQYQYTTNSDSILSKHTELARPLINDGTIKNIDSYFEIRHKKEQEIKKRLSDVLRVHVKHEYAYGTRIYDGIMSLLHSYYELTEISSNFDIAYMIDWFVEGFIEMMEQSNDLCTESYKLFKLSDEALNDFRDILSRVIGDFSKSKRNWLDGHLLTHKVLGSTKKIVTVIYWLIRELDKKIKSSNAIEEGDFHFIITSGGVDIFKAERIFDHIHASVDRRLIVITLPEKNLFLDLKKKTLLLVFHEYFHYASSDVRNKKLRKKCYLQALSLYITDVIICESIEYGIKARIKAALIGNGVDIYVKETLEFTNKCIGIIKKKIYSEIIYPMLSKDLESDDSIIYFNDILKRIKKSLNIMLDPVDKEKREYLNDSQSYNEDSPHDVLRNPVLYQTDIIVKIADCMVFTCHQVAQYSNADYASRRDILETAFESNLDKWVIESPTYMERGAYSLLKIHFICDVQRLFEFISGRIGSIKTESIYDPYRNAKLFRDAFRESFADVCSIYTTNCNAKDYIDCILADPKLKTTNELNVGELMRMFMTLKICFANDEVDNAIQSMSCEDQLRFKNWIRCYAPLVQQMITKPLEDYLEKCINDLANKIELRKYMPLNIFKDAIVEDPTTAQEIAFFDTLYKTWSEIDDCMDN